MSEPSTQTAAPPPALSRDALRIVLFGMPAAGKTSLLGALAQAAQTQEHLLHGRLGEPSQGLAELQQRLYEESPRRTVEEVVPYPVVFEPFAQPGQEPAAERWEAVLIDCDGRVATDLLMRRQTLPEDSPEGSLAREIVEADTLLLAIDVSAPPSQIDADFADFGRFLRLLERGRGQRFEVGGLPVFLVLTKCDLLAEPNDSPVVWMERIEERKRQVDRRFQDFLKRKESEEGPLPFGRIDLHLWATAVKRPALAGAPERPREPYGVAELFRQCLETARAFRQRRQRSGRLLLWTVAGSAGVAAGLVALMVALLTGGPQETRPSDLQNKVANFLSGQGQTKAERLEGDLGQLERKLAILTELRNDPQFGSLPEETRTTVADRLEELESYVAYYKRLQQARAPASARSEHDLEEIEDLLKTETPRGLALPREEWRQTRAGRLYAERLDDIKALQRAVENVSDWYRKKREAGDALWTFSKRQPGTDASVNWQAWQREVEKLLADAASPPFPERERIPGSTALTYATVYDFAKVRQARGEWERVRQNLERVRDLSAALGLGGKLPGKPPVLVIPRQPAFTLQDARTRVQELRQDYPQFDRDFTLTNLPEAIVGDVRQAARTNYELLLETGRDVVLQRLQQAGSGDQETVERWREVGKWLKDPQELSAWRVLARVLARLADPNKAEPDPATELASFLGRDRFDLTLKRLILEVPDSLKVRPDGNLAVYHPPTSKQRPALVFEVGNRQRDAQRGVTTYTLDPAGGKVLTYRPGDDFWITLPVQGGAKNDLVLTWARGRSGIYQFERLSRPPRLHRKDQDNTEGEIAEGVTLIVPPEYGEVSRVPDLVPVVRLKR